MIKKIQNHLLNHNIKTLERRLIAESRDGKRVEMSDIAALNRMLRYRERGYW